MDKLKRLFQTKEEKRTKQKYSSERPDFIIKTSAEDPGFHAVYDAPTAQERQKMLIEAWSRKNG